MRMEITISDIPSTSMSGVSTFMYVENPNPVFDMSWDCMVNYYVKLFENRTNENKQYIHEYASIQDLEEDVYGKLKFNTRGGWVNGDFKEIYDSLPDKDKFFDKINDLIMEYGNPIITYYVSYCVKSDIPFRLLSFAKGIAVNKEVISMKEADEQEDE